MFDQLKIGIVGSYDTYDASIASRTIGTPEKKEIKETVPFSNVTYDFSAINGELYWEERELEYVFEITANTPAELENKKIAFAGWVMNVVSEEIHDPFIPDYHFLGTFKEMDFEDDESVEKTIATVIFSVYPYKIANEVSVSAATIANNNHNTIAIVNNSMHPVVPIVEATIPVNIVVDGLTYSFPAGRTKDGIFKLKPGTYDLLAYNTSDTEACSVRLELYCEVF